MKLYRQIGQLRVENEWLKKIRYVLNTEEKRRLIESNHEKLSIRRQCDLLSLNRENLY